MEVVKIIVVKLNLSESNDDLSPKSIGARNPNNSKSRGIRNSNEKIGGRSNEGNVKWEENGSSEEKSSSLLFKNTDSQMDG